MRKSRQRELKRIRHYFYKSLKDRRRADREWSSRIIPPLLERKLKVKRVQKRKVYRDQEFRISFPAKFDLIRNPDEVLSFFEELQLAILIKPVKRIVIDHTTIEEVSPEAAIMLIAELYRADTYAPKCKKLGSSARVEAVSEIFEDIGYWKYFSRKHTGKRESKRNFLMHKTGNRTTPTEIRDVVLHFKDVCRFSVAECKSLQLAIVECMDNVMTHAYTYKKRYDVPLLRHQWWLLAYRETETGEVAFCFYDQGLSIPDTIRTRTMDQLPLFAPSDGEIIIKAVMEGSYSRFKSHTRGRGLPALKRFVDQASSGELVIYSKSTKCTFEHGQKPHAETLNGSIRGTLIIWRFVRHEKNYI